MSAARDRPGARGPGLRANVALMLGCCLVTVYALEAFLFVDPLELRGAHPRDGFDGRGYLEVVRDLRAEGTPVYPVLPVVTWLTSPVSLAGSPVVPLAGVPHATVVMCNEAGRYVTYGSDRFGFNNPDAAWDRRAELALVGDSFAEGWCVPREQSFAALLRRVRPATLNVGYAGHGPLAQLGTIREYVAAHRPARVFWFFYEGNDLVTDLPREMESSVLRRYLEPGFDQQLRRRSEELGREIRRRFDARLADWTPQEPAPAAVSIGKLRTIRALTGLVRREAPRAGLTANALRDFDRILAEAARTVEAWGGSLHFVYLPDLPSAIGDRDPADHDRVLGLAAARGVPTLDLRPDFVNHAAPLSLFPYEEGRHLVRTRGLHYSAAGHRLVATRVLALVREDSR